MKKFLKNFFNYDETSINILNPPKTAIKTKTKNSNSIKIEYVGI